MNVNERFPTGLEAHEISPEDKLLNTTHEINQQLESEVGEMYGVDYYQIKQIAKIWAGKAKELYEKGMEKGENVISWTENKGLPLPQSKIGLRLLSGSLGVAGLAPGLGVLWPVSLVLWKRSMNTGNSEGVAEKNNEKNYV